MLNAPSGPKYSEEVSSDRYFLFTDRTTIIVG
jgi:hypothetical protein